MLRHMPMPNKPQVGGKAPTACDMLVPFEHVTEDRLMCSCEVCRSVRLELDMTPEENARICEAARQHIRTRRKADG